MLYRRVFPEDSTRDERVVKRLLKLGVDGTLDVPERAAAGHTLGRLGDPRFSGDLCLPEFIPLPGGEFWMGSTEEEVARIVEETGEDWARRELPRHRVAVDVFALAKYPTTNAMFARFIEHGGYRNPEWWREAPGGFWRGDGTVKDWLGNVRSHPRFWDEERLNSANQPVVGVSWYEAVAYCRWLTATLDDGCVYRLPTEAEWAYAARGREGRRYAWGDEWERERANTKELGLERTTPVGIFPDGATPEGLLDVTGNVWEWCSDWYAEDAYARRAEDLVRNPQGPERGSRKVLRGGSWYDGPLIVRCASRIGRPGNAFNDIYGFRVARGSLT
jgi:formylglycine-generating enzyme required for sulfatase activity